MKPHLDPYKAENAPTCRMCGTRCVVDFTMGPWVYFKCQCPVCPKVLKACPVPPGQMCPFCSPATVTVAPPSPTPETAWARLMKDDKP
jgi:hypothetical protein